MRMGMEAQTPITSTVFQKIIRQSASKDVRDGCHAGLRQHKGVLIVDFCDKPYQ